MACIVCKETMYPTIDYNTGWTFCTRHWGMLKEKYAAKDKPNMATWLRTIADVLDRWDETRPDGRMAIPRD